MIIKPPDDPAPLLARLEALAAGSGPAATRAAAELKNRRAGLRAENQAQFLIDDQLRKSENWMVIHDLRLEHEGRVAQIDHLLIGRMLNCYVLETKSFHQGIKINESGEFLRWNGFQKKYEGMPSPLAQNDRHVEILRQVVETLNLPTRLGIKLRLDYSPLVLVSNNAQIIRDSRYDSSRVLKMDQLFAAMGKDFDKQSNFSILRSVAKVVSTETLADIARQLAARHAPLHAEDLVGSDTAPSSPAPRPPTPSPVASPAPPPNPAQSVPAPACKACAGSSGAILSGKFGYYFRCSGCQTNTPVRFTCQPGHAPRLRKSGNDFYRDCEGCGSSAHYFTNTA